MTQPEIVRPVPVEEAEPWVRAFFTTLLFDVFDDDFNRRLDRWVRDWDAERTWGVRDRGRWVGTLATEARTYTVPGAGTETRDVTVDALTAVTVAATHRRRGLLTRMLGDSLRAAKERGDALSVLIAAEWPIYGRYGYAPATVAARYRYHPRRRGATPLAGDASRVRAVDAGELEEIAPAVFDAARRLRPGQIDRGSPWWDRRLGLDGYELSADGKANWFVHDGPDGVDGLLSWKVSRDFELAGPLGALEVGEFVAATDDGYRDLWAYLSVLDVVDDDIGGYGTGRVELKAAHEVASCAPTDARADLRLSQRALASIYLGGHRLHQRRLAGDVEELTPGAIDRVDAMFSAPLAPWCQTGF